jgi:hypothetical protein
MISPAELLYTESFENYATVGSVYSINGEPLPLNFPYLIGDIGFLSFILLSTFNFGNDCYYSGIWI